MFFCAAGKAFACASITMLQMIVNLDEVVEMMKKYNVMEKSQLPDISRYDPVALAIGMRPGEVCSIDRPSKSAISSLYYRVCTQ